jgi:hypothetical protein
MKLGLFMMPLHDPKRAYMEVLKQDREAILLADQLGYNEAWVGEHYSCKTEPIPSPLQFMATLIPVTKQIVFGTGVINLPQHHPANVAGEVAQLDHLSEGRYIMGVGPGGLGSDFELFENLRKGPLRHDGRERRYNPQNLGLRSTVSDSWPVLERRGRSAGAVAPRNWAHVETIPEAISTAGGLGHEPEVLDSAACGRERLGDGVRQFHAKQSGAYSLAGLLRRCGGNGAATRPRQLACCPEHRLPRNGCRAGGDTPPSTQGRRKSPELDRVASHWM